MKALKAVESGRADIANGAGLLNGNMMEDAMGHRTTLPAMLCGFWFFASPESQSQTSAQSAAGPAAAASVLVAAKPPRVTNMWNALSLSFSVVNIGSMQAVHVLVREITLDSTRPSKLALPWSLGDIAPGSLDDLHPAFLNAGFSLDGLQVGSKHVATVKGTYEQNSANHSFTLNAAIIVPAPRVLEMPPLPASSAPLPKGFPLTGPLELLSARVQVAAQENAGLWTYTLFNDEEADSPRFIHSFQIKMAAPFVVRGTPEGWTVQTDNHSFVLWSAAGTSSPHPHGLAPGSSLEGFQIHSASSTSEGMVYSTHSWNHKTDTVDRLGLGTVLTPARQR